MTVDVTGCKQTFLGNGVTTVFTFTFIADQASDLSVILVDATGVSTTLSPSQYTLVINAPAVGQLWGVGGTVTYPTAGNPIPNGTTLTVIRNIPNTQDISINNQGAFYPQAVEQALDINTLQMQEVNTKLRYALQAPETDTNPPSVLPTAQDRIDQILGFDDEGDTQLFPFSQFTGTGSTGIVNVLDFIPSALVAGIINNTSNVDVSQYLNNAHLAAGVNGAILYPAGTYKCSRIVYLDGQSINGSGATSTTLTKNGLVGSENNEMFVAYNWLNNIPLLNMQGLTIQNMGFAADSTSTGGYAIVNFANRSRIQNNTILAKTTGNFGGIRMATYTKNGTPITNAGGGANGIHFHNNLIQNCTLGGIVALTTFITAVNPNVSITLSKATFGSGGTNSYTDSDSNTVFTGTSNGTTTILVSNTTNLGVGDEIEGPDVSTDFDGDIYLHMNIISGCGSLDGTSIGSIDSRGMAGWIIVQNKLENAPGPLLNCQSGAHSCLIANNLFDYKCTSQNNIGINYCCNLGCDTNGRNLVANNQFKSSNIVDPSQTYTILNFFPKHQASHMNIASNNFFDIPATFTGTFIAFNVTNPSTLLGASWGNAYDPLMTALQRGNGDAAWAPTLTPGVAPPTPAVGWTAPYVDSGDSNKLKVKASTGTVITLGTP